MGEGDFLAGRLGEGEPLACLLLLPLLLLEEPELEEELLLDLVFFLDEGDLEPGDRDLADLLLSLDLSCSREIC